ncbi:MAG: methyltransferase domain-containing protein [Bacteroidetes bacterium]|nr:methyltransferase domain-containing protein [Bacteroidota bacterium]
MIDKLVELEYSKIYSLDISSTAQEKLKQRLAEKSPKVYWIVDDITNPQNLPENFILDFWHDRTVLHFLTEETARVEYLQQIKKIVKINGFVIIEVFSLEGAKKCSGLNAVNYSKEMLQTFLGNEFEIITSFDHVFTNPNGDPRPYIYSLFKRKRRRNKSKSYV